MRKLYLRLYLIARFHIVPRVLLTRKRLYGLAARRGGDSTTMVNLGGGLFFRPHWTVLDHASPFYPFSNRYIDHDIDLFQSRTLPFDSNSVDFYYSAHTLEHIPQEYCPRIISELHRTLKPGGAARLCMPDYDLIRKACEEKDAEYFARQKERGMTFEEAVVEQIASECVGRWSADEIAEAFRTMSPEEFADHFTSLASREVQKREAGNHINWFNYQKLSTMLADAGFDTIYLSAPQQSRFPELRGSGGWLTSGNFLETKRMLGIDTTHPDRSLFVEAVKS